MRSLEETLGGLTSSLWEERESALNRLAGLPELHEGEAAADLFPALLRCARDESWEVRCALADLLFRACLPRFDQLIGILSYDTHRKVQEATQRAESKWRQLRRRSAAHEHLRELTRLRARDPEAAQACERIAHTMLQRATKTLAHDLVHYAQALNNVPTNLRGAMLREEPLEPHFETLERVLGSITGLARDLQRYGNRDPLEFTSESVLE